MSSNLQISPVDFPEIAQSWRNAGTDPNKFFPGGTTVELEFFYSPDVLAEAKRSGKPPVIDLNALILGRVFRR